MIMQINPDWRLASDPLQWILQKRYQTKGEVRWRSLDLFGNLDKAIVELRRRRILILAGTYHPEALKPLSDALRSVRDDVHAALAAFRTGPRPTTGGPGNDRRDHHPARAGRRHDSCC